jgi:hypothetical protein
MAGFQPINFPWAAVEDRLWQVQMAEIFWYGLS